jgi:hypothetical protein
MRDPEHVVTFLFTTDQGLQAKLSSDYRGPTHLKTFMRSVTATAPLFSTCRSIHQIGRMLLAKSRRTLKVQYCGIELFSDSINEDEGLRSRPTYLAM